MIRKLRKLGMALIATLGVSLLAVPGAQAVEFHSSSEHTIISGEQIGGITWSMGSGFGAVTCSTYAFKGTTSSLTESSWTLEETRDGCSDSFGRPVDIEGSLKYTLTANKNSGGTSDFHVSGSMVQKTTSGGSVVCTVTVTSPQTNNGITYHNRGGVDGIELTIQATNLKNTVEGGFFNCGTSTTSATAGTLQGTARLTGKNTAGEPVELRVE